MKVSATSGSIKDFKTSLIAVGIFDDLKLDKETKDIDRSLNTEISKIVKDFKPELKALRLISSLGKIKADNVLLVVLGKRNKLDLESLRKISATIAKYARGIGVKNYATNIQAIEMNATTFEKSLAVTEGALLGLYRFSKYKTDKTVKEKEIFPETLTLIEPNSKVFKDVERGVEVGSVFADATCYVRDIVNTPACFATPEDLVKEAKKLDGNGIKVKVFDRDEIKRFGMEAFLSVNKGSPKEPKLIVMEYGKGDIIAVIGKGITFDSGGLDLKPAQNIEDMKNYKAGGAAILGIMQVAAKLRLPVRVIGVIPATENIPGGESTKPGDVITAYNKKTIEVVNTDAEGRLILADTISYVEKNYKPKVIIDLATLTGACIVALGYRVAGIMGNDKKLIERLKSSGEKTFERVWELPIWDDY